MKYFFLACLAVCIMLSCSPSRNTVNVGNLAGDWSLTLFPNSSKTLAELFTMKTPELQLSTDRRVTGNTGCNRLTGSFSVNGDEFKFGPLASTKMGCPGYDENIYTDALNRVNRFRLNADQLSLYQDSTLLMTFVKKAASGQ